MMTDKEVADMITDSIYDKCDDLQWKLQKLIDFYDPDSCDLTELSNDDLASVLDSLEDAEKCIDKFKERFAEGEMLW